MKSRLEQLDDIEEGSVRETLNLNQAEYLRKIEELNQNLINSWDNDQRVKALKIAIQVCQYFFQKCGGGQNMVGVGGKIWFLLYVPLPSVPSYLLTQKSSNSIPVNLSSSRTYWITLVSFTEIY